MAKQYGDWMRSHVAEQEEASEFIEFLVSRAIFEVAASNNIRIKYEVRRFGSRAHGVYCLPSSDLDLVCELGEEIWSKGLTPKSILEQVLAFFKDDARMTGVKNAIQAKKTIEFRFAELKVDFTIHVSDTGAHRPSQVTDAVGDHILALSEVAQRVVMLMVDWAKREQVCWNRRGAIGEGLKAIHWSLLVAAWYQEHGCGEEEEHHVHDQSANILRTMIGFYAIFDFSRFRICAFDQPPFTKIFTPASESPPMWISSPVDACHNLADRVTADTVSQIQEALNAAWKQLWVSPDAFWQESWQRWEAYRGREYVIDRRMYADMIESPVQVSSASPRPT